MSTTQNTSGSNTLQFNPISQNLYNTLTSGAGNILSGYMNNPFSNPAYQMGAAQSQKGAQQAGANNISALMQSMRTSGIGGQAGAGFKASQLAQTGRANQAMSSQANVSNVLAALQRQMSAAGTGLSYSPQLTGSNSMSKQWQSGLGTWLPQALGAGLGALTGGLGAGMGLGNIGDQGAPSMVSSIMNPGTFGSLTGMQMPGMAGMPSGGFGGLTNSGGGPPNPFFPGMFGQQ